MLIARVATQLRVLDLERSVRFYIDRLGFTQEFCYGDFYVGLRAAGTALHLKKVDTSDLRCYLCKREIIFICTLPFPILTPLSKRFEETSKSSLPSLRNRGDLVSSRFVIQTAIQSTSLKQVRHSALLQRSSCRRVARVACHPVRAQAEECRQVTSGEG